MPRFDSILEERRCLARDHVLLRVLLSKAELRLAPAMFFMLRTPGPEFPLLSRPMSVCDYERDPGGDWHIEFLLKVVGPGTRVLAALQPGSVLRLLGPFGKPFVVPQGPRRHVLVAGGVGIAPFPALLRELIARGVPQERIALRFGARSGGELVDLERYEAAGIEVALATDDGSRGLHGHVLALLERDRAAGTLRPGDHIYGCGPDSMLRALGRFAIQYRIPCELSLEASMACGFGVCHSCVVPVRGRGPSGEAFRYEKVCTDGPVFPAERLWPEDPGCARRIPG